MVLRNKHRHRLCSWLYVVAVHTRCISCHLSSCVNSNMLSLHVGDPTLKCWCLTFFRVFVSVCECVCIEHVYVYIIAISPVRFVYKIKYSMPNLDCSQCFMVLFFVCFFVVVVVCFLLLFCLKLKNPKNLCSRSKQAKG